MFFQNKQKPIMKIDFDRLCDAFIYRVIYMNLKEPQDKFNNQNHAEIYGSAIDLYFMNNGQQVVIKLAEWMKNNSFCPYIAIHQGDKKTVDVDLEKLYKGLERYLLNFIIKASKSDAYDFPFHKYPITTGG